MPVRQVKLHKTISLKYLLSLCWAKMFSTVPSMHLTVLIAGIQSGVSCLSLWISNGKMNLWKCTLSILWRQANYRQPGQDVECKLYTSSEYYHKTLVPTCASERIHKPQFMLVLCIQPDTCGPVCTKLGLLQLMQLQAPSGVHFKLCVDKPNYVQTGP